MDTRVANPLLYLKKKNKEKKKGHILICTLGSLIIEYSNSCSHPIPGNFVAAHLRSLTSYRAEFILLIKAEAMVNSSLACCDLELLV
jgi:hypothetical protein